MKKLLAPIGILAIAGVAIAATVLVPKPNQTLQMEPVAIPDAAPTITVSWITNTALEIKELEGRSFSPPVKLSIAIELDGDTYQLGVGSDGSLRIRK